MLLQGVACQPTYSYSPPPPRTPHDHEWKTPIKRVWMRIWKCVRAADKTHNNFYYVKGILPLCTAPSLLASVESTTGSSPWGPNSSTEICTPHPPPSTPHPGRLLFTASHKPCPPDGAAERGWVLWSRPVRLRGEQRKGDPQWGKPSLLQQLPDGFSVRRPGGEAHCRDASQWHDAESQDLLFINAQSHKKKPILPRFRYKAKAVYMQDSFLFFSLFFLFSRFDILSQLTWQIVYVVLVIYSDTWQLTVVSTEWLFLFLIPEKPHSLCSLGFLAAHSDRGLADTNSSSSSNFCWWGSTQMYSLFFFFLG